MIEARRLDGLTLAEYGARIGRSKARVGQLQLAAEARLALALIEAGLGP